MPRFFLYFDGIYFGYVRTCYSELGDPFRAQTSSFAKNRRNYVARCVDRGRECHRSSLALGCWKERNCHIVEINIIGTGRT